MKKAPKAIQTLINKSADHRTLTRTVKYLENSDDTKATMSLPQKIVENIEMLKTEHYLTPRMVMHMIVMNHTYMERVWQEDGEDYYQVVRSAKDEFLANVFDPDKLQTKSYKVGRGDAVNLSIIAKATSISRNEIVAMGVLVIVGQVDQWDDSYNEYVAKYKASFESILGEVQSLKSSSLRELGNLNDQVVLMAGRLERHIQLQLMHFDKYLEKGIWYLGTSDSENVDYAKLIADLFGESKREEKNH
jgi:hypothetical protein